MADKVLILNSIDNQNQNDSLANKIEKVVIDPTAETQKSKIEDLERNKTETQETDDEADS